MGACAELVQMLVRELGRKVGDAPMTMKLYPFQEESVKKFIDVPSVLNGDDMGLLPG